MIVTQNTSLNRLTWMASADSRPGIFHVSFGIDIHLAAVVINFYNVPEKTVSDDSIDTIPVYTA
jgi:hypothetical protein